MKEVKGLWMDLEFFFTSLRPLDFFVKNVLEYLFRRVIVEWKISGEEFVGYDAK